MAKRKKRIVLTIGFIIVALSFIAMMIMFVIDFDRASNLDKKIVPAIYLFIVFPVVLEEIILLRDVYQLVNVKLKSRAGICYLASFIIVFLAAIFQFLAFAGVITASDLFSPGPGGAPTSRFTELLLLSEWPVMILSLVLMGIGRWQNDKNESRETDQSDPSK